MNDKLNYNRWLNNSYIDEADREELKKMTEDEIHEAFYKNVEFGTSGMRGIMGLGINRLNKYTIRMAAKGLAELVGEGASIVIAYDTRNNSKSFAQETAMVLAAAGVKVYLFDRYSPVPLLSYATRKLGCAGGVAITASHNMKQYNGFKVYDSTGCQLDPEKAGFIAEYIKKISDDLVVETACLKHENIVMIGDEVITDYLEAVDKCKFDMAADITAELNVMYTPIHGSGRDYVMKALTSAGFDKVKLVDAQADYNGEFPTVRKPNPEEPECFDVAIACAEGTDTDIIIGTDPDSDRIGAVIKHNSEFICLSGNQIGNLLIDFLAKQQECKGKKLITTIVTSEMGAEIARSYDIDVKRTLTGFKYICGYMNEMDPEEFFMGYEESYGYLVGTHTRDKDAVSAAVVLCQMAAYYKHQGKTLIDVMNDLYEKHGFYIDEQESFVFRGSKGAEKINEIMMKLREEGEFAFSEVGPMKEIKDYRSGVDGLPLSNVFKYIFENGSWVAVRPSGTEPKIKFYYCIKGSDRIASQKMYDKLKKSVAIITES